MPTTSTKLAAGQKTYRIPLRFGADLHPIINWDWDEGPDDDEVQVSSPIDHLVRDAADAATTSDNVIEEMLTSLIEEEMLRGIGGGLGIITPSRIPMGSRTTLNYFRQATAAFTAGSLPISASVERAGLDIDVYVRTPHHGTLVIPKGYPVLSPTQGLFADIGLTTPSSAAHAKRTVQSLDIFEAHQQIRSRYDFDFMQRPDLTARLANRLAEIPYMAHAEDSALPKEDVINAALRIAGYLPATTSLPQIEIDDSTGSISLVWRDDLHDSVFSLEIPNSRYVIGVGFGKDFSKFKPWRHLISDERKIVAEIESSDTVQKLLSGA